MVLPYYYVKDMTQMLAALTKKLLHKQDILGLTDVAFARLIGISTVSWRSIKHGTRGKRLSGDTILKIFQAFPDLIFVVTHGKPELFIKVADFGVPTCPYCQQPLQDDDYYKRLASAGGEAGGKKGGEATLSKIGIKGYSDMGKSGGRGNKKNGSS
jgi:hypothetical protein